MSFYEYDNGYYHCKTPIRDGFKRFHKCNAQESHFTLELTDDINAGQPQHVFQFISYNTPICQIIYAPAHYGIKWYIYIDENAYEFSRTTTKQFNRWLNEHARYGTLQDVWPRWLDSYYVRSLFDNREQYTPTSATNADASKQVAMLVCDDLSRVWR